MRAFVLLKGVVPERRSLAGRWGIRERSAVMSRGTGTVMSLPAQTGLRPVTMT